MQLSENIGLDGLNNLVGFKFCPGFFIWVKFPWRMAGLLQIFQMEHLCPLPQVIRTAIHLLTALIFPAFSQVDTANCWSNYSKWAPSSQHQQSQSDCSTISFFMNGWQISLRLLRLFSYAKTTLCRHWEQYSVCCTVLIHFFNIWKCYFSLSLVLLLVNKLDCFWVTFLLWYFFP